MARIRTIKPEFWKNEALSELPEATHMLAASLLNYADDAGYFNANPRLIQAECFPLRELSVSVQESLIHLSRVGYLKLGKGEDGRDYGLICSFSQHQVINRPTASKIAVLSIDWTPSLNAHGVVCEVSLPEGKGREQGTGNGEREGKGSRSEDLLSLCSDDAPSFEAFWDRFGNKTAKANAQKAWSKLKTDDRIAAFDASLGWLSKWQSRHPGASPLHPATFLNNRRWEDEQPQQSGFNGYPPRGPNAGSGQQPGGLVGAAIRSQARSGGDYEGWS